MPDTLTPEQMQQMTATAQPSQGSPSGALPDVLTPQQMETLNPPPAQPSTGARILSTVGGIANNIERPFVNVAAMPLQLGIAAFNKITGKNVQDPYAQGMPGIGNAVGASNIPVSSSTTLSGLSQKSADVANIALMGLGGEAQGVRALGLVGAGQGLAQGLGEGDTNPGDLIKDTIGGGIFGGTLGAGQNFLRWMSGAELAKTGVVGQVANEIKNADPSLVQSYIDTTLNHADDIRVPTPDALAESAMQNRADILTSQVIPKAGQAVGAARAAAGNLPLQLAGDTGSAVGPTAVDQVSDNINTAMQNMTGHQFGAYANPDDALFKVNSYPQGMTSMGIHDADAEITPLPGRSIDLSSKEEAQLEKVWGYLQTLKEAPTVQTASDVLNNLDNDIGKWDTPQFGENSGNSPVQGVLRFARGSINQAIRGASPDLAAANDQYSSLMDLKSDIGAYAGKDLRSASLFMRRVLSGDKSAEVIPTLDKLSQITAPYVDPADGNLVQHAVIADWAKRTFGDTSTTGLLQQSVNRGVNDASSIFGYPKQFVRGVMQKALGAISPDPEAYATSLASGEAYSMNPVVRGLEEFNDAAKNTPVYGSLVKQLESMGVTPSNVEPAANAILKSWLLTTFTHPANLAPPNGVPTAFTPGTVPQRTLTP